MHQLKPGQRVQVRTPQGVALGQVTGANPRGTKLRVVLDREFQCKVGTITVIVSASKVKAL